MSRSLLHDWEYAIDKCCREDNPTEMISIAEDIYNTAYARGQNHSNELEKVLDKIRAEMDVARFIDKDTKLCKNANASGLEVAMQIIDKYKAESEG